jgi:tRNA(Ile)-lysidine synthase
MSFSTASLRAVLEAHAPAGATGLVIAMSGGADSACLLAAAAQLGTSFGTLGVRAVHVDHGLQAAAAELRQACARICAQLQVPLSVVSVAVDAPAGASIEAAARDARYAALAEVLQSGECLLTAHHATDQAETLLLQALRGAGLKGLSGMPVCRAFGRGWHLRPLLNVAQRDLLKFGAETGIAAVTDPMNEDLRFDRAYLRLKIWPLIENRWPGASVSLGRSAAHLAEAQDLLDAQAAADVDRLRDGDALSVPGLRALGAARQINALRFWISSAAAVPPSTARLSEAVRQIFAADSERMPAIVWGQCALRRYRERLFLTEATPPQVGAERPWRAAPGASVELGEGLGRLRWVAQDGGIAAQRLPQMLTVRRRRGGEKIKPGAQARTQSVQHLCQSIGVLPWMRDALPLVFAGDELILIGDLWLDARWCGLAGQPGLGCVWDDAPMLI